MLDSVLVAPTEVRSNESVPAGDVAGVVVDAYRGTPLPGTAVGVRYLDTPERPFYVVADGNGFFHLVHLRPGRTVVRFARIGYPADSIVVSGDSGYVARVGLAAHKLSIPCDLVDPPEPAPAVTAVVHDARTGVAPVTPVRLRLRDGKFADSASRPQMNGADAVTLGAAKGRDGKYEVDVSAPGYEPVRIRNVRTRQRPGCHFYEGRTLELWLMPAADGKSAGAPRF